MNTPTDPRKFTVTDLFTKEELELAFDIIRKRNLLDACNDVLREESQPTVEAPKTLNEMLIEQVIAPAMPRIDKLTGETNFAPYLAYVLQYAYAKAIGKP